MDELLGIVWAKKGADPNNKAGLLSLNKCASNDNEENEQYENHTCAAVTSACTNTNTACIGHG